MAGPTPLRGTVKLDDRPLANATVYFIAQNSGGRDALGTTNAEGVFHLSTLKSGDGAFPGKYKVVAQPAAPAEPGLAPTNPREAMKVASRRSVAPGHRSPAALQSAGPDYPRAGRSRQRRCSL